eukprot:m.63049 g.63049  ORF g.63049 m.63049 type:complete len:399 (+) comp7170_c0_seq1:109-1305(+)
MAHTAVTTHAWIATARSSTPRSISGCRAARSISLPRSCQVWMLSRLYNERAEYHTPEILAACTSGAEFLRKHVRREDDRVYFCVAANGEPVKLQRKVFAECFFVMAMSEYALAIKASQPELSASIFAEALAVFEAVLRFSKDLTQVGVQPMSGQPATHALAIPMITLNVICEIRRYNGDRIYETEAAACIPQIMLHVKPDLKMVLEVVGPAGEVLDSSEGRLLNPGHAIEAGWFILDYASKYGGEKAAELQQVALDMIEWSYDLGWDHEYGGIYYFLDSKGHTPELLEWPMKLWWVHNETMVATLMAYKVTREEKWWKKFVQVTNYTMARFPDSEENALQIPLAGPGSKPLQPGGEWFGYLDRFGRVSQRFKGGPYKGCFHVPRALHLVEGMLRELLH